MVLFVVGLGLGDEKDVTVRGLECIKSCKRLYLEYYTSVLGVDSSRLQEYYGIQVIVCDRNTIENEADSIYSDAIDSNIGFLVVGDPLCATTHTDLILRAKSIGCKVEVIHNVSVMGAVASCGLQLYQYGYTVSIPLFEGNWKPSSFYDRIKYNKNGGMHTLCLLDIKVKEPDYSNIKSSKLVYLPPRFMNINTAIKQLLYIESTRNENIVTEESYGVGMARLGQSTKKIVYGKLKDLIRVDFGPPLHCLALCGETHPLEIDILQYYEVQESDMTYIEESIESDKNSRSDSDVDDN